jgi:hypothetical protein
VKFRKKPVVIEAFQWNESMGCVGPICRQPGEGMPHYIQTLEGSLFVSDGDWIITGVKGEHYPCKPDIFEATYEPVAEPKP